MNENEKNVEQEIDSVNRLNYSRLLEDKQNDKIARQVSGIEHEVYEPREQL